MGSIFYGIRRKMSKMILITTRDSDKCTKPCCECLKVIKKIGIKKIGYMDEDGKMIIRKVNSLNEDECKYTKSFMFNGGRKKFD